MKSNRLVIVVGAILMQISIGNIYSWSLFSHQFKTFHSFTESELALTFSISIFIFALTTMVSGRLQDKYGPRIVCVIGALLFGGGFILTSLSSSLIYLYLFYGILAGAGVGFVYVCPLSTCLKWFPNHKGIITGVVVGAFGLGSFVFIPLIQTFLNHFTLSQTLIYLGFIFLFLILFLYLFYIFIFFIIISFFFIVIFFF